MSNNISEVFGSEVFNDHVMKEMLDPEVYEELHATIDAGNPLDVKIANQVAAAMRDWALSRGATHFTHWFQPLTGVTAEKHDSFLSGSKGGLPILEFKGKELIKGESDASSFPSGGLRATFEARGYTAWDPTSYAFIKNDTLYIPTAFCSYSGEALDTKTPLLRSMEAISRSACRILKLFGNNTKRVIATCGPEQEYFLIDRDMYARRKDLIFTGRTLYGAKPPKGQELEDHYYGMLKTRVQDFMRDIDTELWRVGVMAKTEHNEVAPSQHELAPIFATANIASDHNQLTMELLRKVAHRHGFKCLLHEKPFEGINGSGKHDNWSLSTAEGMNLFEPGSTPSANMQFLLFLCAVIKGVNEYQDLLRISVASAGNDHRLGANEAPPAIISMFLGDELTGILEAIAEDREYFARERTDMETGVNVLPHFLRDTTDRNRTSPFAFTGNKFEFRSPGSSQSIAVPTTMLNSIVADELDGFYEELKDAPDFGEALQHLIRRTIIENKNIVFNGDGYSREWVEEAARRGLHNLPTTPDALPHLCDERNVKLFERQGVYSRTELESRYVINLENYCKIIKIESLTMIEMAKKDILPAVSTYVRKMAEAVSCTRSIADVECGFEVDMIRNLTNLSTNMYKKMLSLEELISQAPKGDDQRLAEYYRDAIIPAMDRLRAVADEIEPLVGEKYWPYPTYGRMLFAV
jgi:glutamine synthetase